MPKRKIQLIGANYLIGSLIKTKRVNVDESFLGLKWLVF